MTKDLLYLWVLVAVVSICVINSIHVDFVIRVPRIPSIGETIRGEGYEVHPGGKGAN